MPAQNYTIDDSQWSTPSLALSGGWNMLRTGGSNEYIDADDVQVMRPLLGGFWNSSVSWTKHAGSWTTLTFIGTDIWAYGMSGQMQGTWSAEVDDKPIGTYSATGDVADYRHLLFSAHNLRDGVGHTLRLENREEGRWLVFDYAVVQTAKEGLGAPFPASAANASLKATSTAPSTASSTAAPPSGLSLNLTVGGLDLSQGQHQYSASQLALVSTPYKFHWNSAAYFVVVFAGILSLTAMCLAGMYVFPSRLRSQFSGIRPRGIRGASVKSGQSFLGLHNGSRRQTRLLDALRNGKISYPIPSEDGHSTIASERVGDEWKEGRGWA